MTWSYRIIRHKTKEATWYAIHEVYYDKRHKPEGITENPVHAIGDSPLEVQQALSMMIRDALRLPVLDYNKIVGKRKRSK